MKEKNILYTKTKVPMIIGTLLLFISVMIGACDEEPEYMGVDLIPETIGGNVFKFMDSTVIAKTVKVDSTLAYSKTAALLGNIRNDVFGHTSASFAVNYIGNRTSVDLTGYSYDSIQLEFRINSYIGDSSANLNLKVYRIIKELVENSNELDIHSDISKYKKETINENIEFTPWNYYENDTTTDGTSINLAKIKLNDQLGKELFELIKDGTVDTDTNFVKEFGGLYVESQNENANSLVQADLTNCLIKVYYSKVDTVPLSYTFTKNYGYAFFKENTQGSTIANIELNKESEITYIKSNRAYETKLSFPSTEKFLDVKGKALMKAELTVNSQGISDMPIKALRLIYKQDNVTYSVLSSKTSISVDSYYSPKKEYKFDITYYLKQYMDGSVQNLDLYIAPYWVIPSNYSNIANTKYAKYLYQWGIINNTKEQPIKLRILYSQP